MTNNNIINIYNILLFIDLIVVGISVGKCNPKIILYKTLSAMFYLIILNPLKYMDYTIFIGIKMFLNFCTTYMLLYVYEKEVKIKEKFFTALAFVFFKLILEYPIKYIHFETHITFSNYLYLIFSWLLFLKLGFCVSFDKIFSRLTNITKRMLINTTFVFILIICYLYFI